MLHEVFVQAILSRKNSAKPLDKGSVSNESSLDGTSFRRTLWSPLDSRGFEAVLGIFHLFDAQITQEAYEYTGDVLAVTYTQRLSITSKWRKSA